jgi:hypothetical protein
MKQNKMEQNTIPEGNIGGQPTQIELTNISLIFGRALALILEENQGIVVDIKGDIKLDDDVKKVIVFKMKDNVHIYKCDEDLPEGTPLTLDPENQ